MPEICRFYGIVIKMYFADHAPPHFHAEYAEHEVRIAIDSLAVVSGALPARAMGLVIEWATLHQAELRALWDQARNSQPLHRLAPLS
ncbi:MAG: DUF4160 domain-containing protein [Cyanobacteria bacterium]|nr:DUF4160 domain-containing protein [Cyanobacteriota bacterium]